jgi:HK97 family phage portal protein
MANNPEATRMLDFLMPPAMLGQPGTWDRNAGWVGVGIGNRSKTRAGVTVDEEIALTYEAVFRATCCLAEGIGGVPLPCYERVTEHDRRLAHLESAHLLRFQVNPSVMAGVARERAVAHQVNWGNGYFEIEFYPGTDRVRWLWPIHPSRVSRSKDPHYFYAVRNNNGTETKLHAHEMLHIPGAISEDGIFGRGVIGVGRETIGGGLGVDRASYAHLGTGGQPKGILTAPGLNDREKRREYRKEWEEVHGNPEANVPTLALLNPGATYVPLGGLSNEQNQLIQTRQLNKANIATLYGIPAYKLGAESKETAGTIEQKAIEFVVYSLLPWARKIEEQCNFKLLQPAQWDRFYFEHNFAALLRGDITARYTAYRIGISTGFLTINQVCRLENLPSIGPAGDQHFIPANLTTAERALNGDFGNGGTVGSDTTGAPADNPNDHPAGSEAAFSKLLRTVTTRAQRAELDQQLRALEANLPERKINHVEVARTALLDVLGRMFTKESNAALRAAKDHCDFDAWTREFYCKHQVLMADALRTACGCLRIAGLPRWADRLDLADWLTSRSSQELLASYNTDTPEVFARKLARWPTERAERLTAEILGA